MLAGASSCTIELKDILPFDGFDEVLHPTHARVLVIEADVRAAIVALELTSIAPSLLAELRAVVMEETGCEDAFVWVCATHTFSAPHVRTASHLASDEERARNDCLLAAYVGAVRTAVREAVVALAPARLLWGVGTCSVNVNRDVETPGGWWLGANPNGFSDHSLRALRLVGEDGATIAVVASADVQSSVLDRSCTADGRRLVSGDLTGLVCTRLEESLSGCTVLFLVGTAGDQAPAEQAVRQIVAADGSFAREDAHEEGFAMLERQADRLASELAATLETTTELPGEPISADRHQLLCPGQRRADFHSLSPKRSFVFEADAPVSTTVNVLRLGGVILVGLEPEVSSAFGAQVRAAAGAVACDVLTLVNGAAKYLPDEDAYDKITYEAMNSGFARGASEVLYQDVVSTIAAIAKTACDQTSH